MSIGAISASIHAIPNATNQAVPKTATTAAIASPTTTSNIVNVAAAALKEATETSAETAKEAGHGDRVAQRLLAKQHPASAAHAQTPTKGSVNGSGQITGEIINTNA